MKLEPLKVRPPRIVISELMVLLQLPPELMVTRPAKVLMPDVEVVKLIVPLILLVEPMVMVTPWMFAVVPAGTVSVRR